MDSETKKLKWAIRSAVLLILFMLTKPFVIINAGEVGIVYSFGSIVGQVTEGLNWIAPWQFVTTTNIKVQREVIEKLASFSNESQNVYIKTSINYQVSPDAVQTLFRAVGKDYYHVLIEPRLMQNFKDETVKFRSVDIAPNREKIRQAVRARLELELKAYSIHVIDLLLDNIDFDPAFNQAILKKQVATQNSLEEAQLVEVSKQRALQKVETERGEGLAALARAEKVAEANNKIAASLTANLLQMEYLKKWDGKRPMVEGSSSGLLLQLPKQ